jgi:hypothetical protein
LDDKFALGWATLAHAALMRSGTAEARAELEAALAMARRAAQRALALDPTLPSAHLAMSTLQGWYDFDWEERGEIDRIRPCGRPQTIPLRSRRLQAWRLLSAAMTPQYDISSRRWFRDPLNAGIRLQLGSH